ncbi:ATP-dependent RNA helicase DDX1-like [Paramacrobiotus metropolitanus]|uniref:ATP-dependent RNA helicase DDX1-like n=1 Tax=Paramacrobiotus metropolitanus TaxID=2943436 RepID=UPI002446517C|nr:ATP-dependent RNA helicase DDX1-like [Paramacrobiotus metropolitanus]
MTAFEEFGVLPEIAKAVEEMEWNLPTDIQAEAIPAILGGGDVLMAAETGTGKTGAFCLPILQIVWETVRDQQMGKYPKPSGDQRAVGGSANTKWGLNMYDRDPLMAIDPDLTTCQSRDQQAWQGCRANRGLINSGKYYYEATVTDEGLCRVGWSTGKANRDLGTDKFGYGFGGTGKKSWNKQFDSYGESYGKDDVVGCFLDLHDGVVFFSKNGKIFAVASNLDPQLRNAAVFPAVVLKNAEMHFNFGDQPFKFPPPDGFVACSHAPANNVVMSDASAPAHPLAGGQSRPNAPMAIILEPTRELAEQALAEIRRFKKYLKDPTVRELCVVGGTNSRDQVDALHQGVDIIVGTPGRLEDLVASNDILLNNIRFFVLDEADGLLSQGNWALINRFHGKIPQVTPDGKRLQMIVCSATLHNFEVKKLADQMMRFPTWIDLKGQDSVPETVHHVLVKIDPKTDLSWQNMKRSVQTDGVHSGDRLSFQNWTPEVLSEAVKLLKAEYVVAAVRKFNMDQALIFCRTKLDCDNLERYLTNIDRNLTCVCLHGDRKPQERQQNLQAFKDARVRFLICTDVAARGLDIRGIPFVINVTLPDEVPNYIHRIGRVGRAERMGLAISLVATVQEKVWYHTCQSKGQSCHNTRLKDEGGCCIWYNEVGLMGEIEEHLGVTVPEVGKEMNVPVDEFEGKVTYGQKRQAIGTGYKDHVGLLQATVTQLADLEKRAQTSFLQLRYLNVPGANVGPQA